MSESKFSALWASIAIVSLFWQPLGSQQVAQAPLTGAAGAGPVALASRANEAPGIDGVVDDRVWQQATPLTTFTQNEPAEGQPASEKTEVRVLFDDNYVYVGVICYDSDPSQIIVTDSRRDSSLSETDSFQMIFDTTS